MTDHAKRFIIKLLAATAPFLALLMLYVILDPFKVLRAYDTYYMSGKPAYVNFNPDVVGIETFRRRNAERPYDAFILGNLRSRFYHMDDWLQHIGPAHGMHLDGAAESLYGVHAKALYLDRSGAPLRHVLIVLDGHLLSNVGNSWGHLYRKHPLLSGESRLSFQFLFLKTFLDPRFLTAYLHLIVTGQFHPYMSENALLSNERVDYDADANETRLPRLDALIANDPATYYAARKQLFYDRPATLQHSPQTIGPLQRHMLSDIYTVLTRHGCDYRIVVSPLYDQKQLHPADLATLRTIFDPARIYDYSGSNAFTQSCTNYYESSHYRPHVACAIMDLIYAPVDMHSRLTTP